MRIQCGRAQTGFDPVQCALSVQCRQGVLTVHLSDTLGIVVIVCLSNLLGIVVVDCLSDMLAIVAVDCHLRCWLS